VRNRGCSKCGEVWPTATTSDYPHHFDQDSGSNGPMYLECIEVLVCNPSFWLLGLYHFHKVAKDSGDHVETWSRSDVRKVSSSVRNG